MLPISSQELFETNRLLEFGFEKRAKCCPFFSQELFQDKSIFWGISVSKQGEMLPIFSQEFFDKNRFLVFGFEKRAKCCPFFPKNFLTKIDF